MKVNCRLYVLSKFFVLRWQFYRKNGMLEGCSQMQGWKNVAVLYPGWCFFPTERVSFCNGHRAWLPGLHPPFCDGSPSIFPSGPTPPHYNTGLTIIFSLLWPWIFRGVMSEWRTIGDISVWGEHPVCFLPDSHHMAQLSSFSLSPRQFHTFQ